MSGYLPIITRTRRCDSHPLNHLLSRSEGYRRLRISHSPVRTTASHLLDNSNLRMGMIEATRKRQSIGLNRGINSRDRDRDMGISKEVDMESQPERVEECKLTESSA
jgi:hypothetical protein